MKRHPHITQLSGDHHAVMTVSQRILAGLERGADPAVIGDYALHAWERWIASHNRLEEKLLVDGLADHPIDPRMVRRLIQEHQEMVLLGAKLADVETVPARQQGSRHGQGGPGRHAPT